MFGDNVQIRLFTGEAVTQKFGVREQLAAVRLFAHGKIAGGQIDGDIGALTFATAFPPRRVFTEDDMMLSLGDLGSCLLLPYLCCLFNCFIPTFFLIVPKKSAKVFRAYGSNPSFLIF